MKKAIVLFVMVLDIILVGCSSPNTTINSDDASTNPMDTVEFITGIDQEKVWKNDEDYDWTADPVFDSKTALNIAIVYFENVKQECDGMINYVPTRVFYDTEDEVYVVLFMEKSNNKAGGDFNIALNKCGQVLRMWAGE